MRKLMCERAIEIRISIAGDPVDIVGRDLGVKIHRDFECERIGFAVGRVVSVRDGGERFLIIGMDGVIEDDVDALDGGVVECQTVGFGVEIDRAFDPPIVEIADDNFLHISQSVLIRDGDSEIVDVESRGRRIIRQTFVLRNDRVLGFDSRAARV